MPITSLCKAIEIETKTAIDWYNFIRDICCTWNHANPPLLGGLNEDLENLIVEVDETVIDKMKYNVGRVFSTKWLFGGIQRGTQKSFLELIPNRRSETLLPLL